jgi:guanine deaminase
MNTAGSLPDEADVRWLSKTIELATGNVAAGGGPFAALVVQDGRLLATGHNRVTRDNDPTAHAEVTAIRAACAATGDFRLAGATLYTSCEPCPMCMASALWARLRRVVYAADRHDAAEGGFDDREFWELFMQDRVSWPTGVELIQLPDRRKPFQAWLAAETRTDY